MTAYLQSIITRHLKANPFNFLKECSALVKTFIDLLLTLHMCISVCMLTDLYSTNELWISSCVHLRNYAFNYFEVSRDLSLRWTR